MVYVGHSLVRGYFPFNMKEVGEGVVGGVGEGGAGGGGLGGGDLVDGGEEGMVC